MHEYEKQRRKWLAMVNQILRMHRNAATYQSLIHVIEFHTLVNFVMLHGGENTVCWTVEAYILSERCHAALSRIIENGKVFYVTGIKLIIT